MRQRLFFIVLLCLLLFSSVPFSNAQDARLQIVGSHSILSDVIANVAGDVADVTSLMPLGADPHSFQPTPGDLTALADADVVFINGAFFEEGLLEAIENATDEMNIVTASSCVEIIPFGGHDDDHEEGEEQAHEEDENHAHEDEDHAHEADDEHEHESETGEMSAIAQLCEQHYAEMEALHEAGHEHEEGEEHDHDHTSTEITDLSTWAGEWLSGWVFDADALQPGYDAVLAETPEISPELLMQYHEAGNFTVFDTVTFSEIGASFDGGNTCDYTFAGQMPITQIAGETWSLFETADETCADTRYLLLNPPHAAEEGASLHFHMRYGSTSFEEIAADESPWFPSIYPIDTTADALNNVYIANARLLGLYVATVYGVDVAMSDEEQEVVQAMTGGETHEHEHHEIETLGALYALDCGAGHDDEEEENGEGEEHEHEHGACDPHVWMEPHNVMYWTMLIRDTLIELDPANADVYTANASEYLEALDALAHDFIGPMVESVPEENRILITNHDAFGYFAARAGFEVAITIIPSGSTLAEPSTADIAAVIDLIREENVPAIFAETTVSDDLAQQIAEETGAQVYVLYSGSLSDADGPASTYIDYIRYNVTTIIEALGGGM